MALNSEKIREDFPILKRKVNGKKLVYLDSAATSQKPKQVIQAISEYYSSHNSNVHRGIHTLAAESTGLLEASRKKIASFINASPDEIIFVRNATEAINLVRYTFGMQNIRKGDSVINSIMEHHSNHVPWLTLSQETGSALETVNLSGDYGLDIGAIEGTLHKPQCNPKLLALTHCSNVLGTVTPARELAKLAHSAGALFLLDACQSVPHMQIDVRSLDCDFMAFSGHKLLGPTGVGVLYAKKEVLETLPPFLFGGDMIKSVGRSSVEFNELPYRFEAGTPDIAGIIGLGAAVDYLSSIGMQNIWAHEQKLIAYAIEQFQAFGLGTQYGPAASSRAGILTFTIPAVHPHDIAQVMNDNGVAIRSGHHCAQPLHEFLGIGSSARASFYLYNDYSDVDALISGLKEVRRIFIS